MILLVKNDILNGVGWGAVLYLFTVSPWIEE